MAVTAGGTPYVESSDLVANYPAVSLALAEHIDGLGSGVLQVVRATDATERTTTSASYVDANISVTITPTATSSLVLLVWSFRSSVDSDTQLTVAITDTSNNVISGAEAATLYSSSGSVYTHATVLAYATPATTSAVTYKGRFRREYGSGTVNIRNASNTGQLYAIEVSA